MTDPLASKDSVKVLFTHTYEPIAQLFGFDAETGKGEGLLVRRDFEDILLRQFAMPSFYWKPKSWEERLADAIEARRIPNRLRRFRWDWQDRLTIAIDAIRGRHYCE